jgi:hypothetical protein
MDTKKKRKIPIQNVYLKISGVCMPNQLPKDKRFLNALHRAA